MRVGSPVGKLPVPSSAAHAEQPVAQ
jgi:hypothetical protein